MMGNFIGPSKPPITWRIQSVNASSITLCIYQRDDQITKILQMQIHQFIKYKLNSVHTIIIILFHNAIYSRGTTIESCVYIE